MVIYTISGARLIAEETFFIDNGKVEPPLWTNELLKNQETALKQYLRIY